ncbi:9552_t:CDS:2 [Funneliformis geosporum]|uniref:3425_t:CDS:1 n=1 Tax=Funneliformis geosporum TaxID=1117311 RepID=A0A9W4T0P0_9GLOM|nr:9552_t:CDS:2 [Funneliformis geosporum]CAI2188255.1 3425_t:CDS:2 [Funneliformis geosporum]
MTEKRQQKRNTVEAESESTPQETSRKASKKQKTVVAPVVAPTRHSERIFRQDSGLARATKSLRINSGSDSRSSYELKDLPPMASKYSEEDMEALNVIFVPASNDNEVIPNIQASRDQAGTSTTTASQG